MITPISNKREGSKTIRTYNVIGRVSEFNTLQQYFEELGDVFFETIEVQPLWLTPRCNACFVFYFPEAQNQLSSLDQSWVNDGVSTNFPQFAKGAQFTTTNTNPPITKNITGLAVPIQQNYSFAPLIIPVFSRYNGPVGIFFVNNNIDPQQANGYLVKITVVDNKGKA